MKISFPVMLVFILMTPILAAQHSIANEGSMTPAERAVARVAQEYIATRNPDFDSVKNPPIVHDKGDSWEVEYELPMGVIGGTPIVVIDKATLKVLRSFHAQ